MGIARAWVSKKLGLGTGVSKPLGLGITAKTWVGIDSGSGQLKDWGWESLGLGSAKSSGWELGSATRLGWELWSAKRLGWESQQKLGLGIIRARVSNSIRVVISSDLGWRKAWVGIDSGFGQLKRWGWESLGLGSGESWGRE